MTFSRGEMIFEEQKNIHWVHVFNTSCTMVAATRGAGTTAAWLGIVCALEHRILARWFEDSSITRLIQLRHHSFWSVLR